MVKRKMPEDLATWFRKTIHLLFIVLKFFPIDVPRWLNCNVAHQSYWVITRIWIDDDGMRCKKCGRTFLCSPYSGYPEELDGDK